MAQLSISIGALSSSVSASNTKAAEVLQNFALAKEFSGTDQEKLDQIVAHLAQVLTSGARSYLASQAVKEAQEAAGSDPDNDWSD
jgi:hypothetical protein